MHIVQHSYVDTHSHQATSAPNTAAQSTSKPTDLWKRLEVGNSTQDHWSGYLPVVVTDGKRRVKSCNRDVLTSAYLPLIFTTNLGSASKAGLEQKSSNDICEAVKVSVCRCVCVCVILFNIYIILLNRSLTFSNISLIQSSTERELHILQSATVDYTWRKYRETSLLQSQSHMPRVLP